MIKVLRIVALLSIFLVSATVTAANDDKTASAGSSTHLPPNLLIKKTADKVLTLVQTNRKKLEADPSGIYELVYQYVLPHFNFQRMSRSVLGKHWHSASAEQRTSFIRQFQILLVRTYAVALLNYSNEAITYLPFHLKPKAKLAQVKSKVSDGSGIDLPVNYLLLKMKQGDWKVVDVKIDGISLVSNYRTSFAAQVRRTGIAGLIKQLMARNSFLAQETGVTDVDEPSTSGRKKASKKKKTKTAKTTKKPSATASKKTAQQAKSKQVKTTSTTQKQKPKKPTSAAKKSVQTKTAKTTKKPTKKSQVSASKKQTGSKPANGATTKAEQLKKEIAKADAAKPNVAKKPKKAQPPSFIF